MSLSRTCSKSSCTRGAVATLTYVYADQTVVVGPLATFAEPHCYDLCVEHAESLTVPRGWKAMRLGGDYPEPEPGHDDLLAVANAVRETGREKPTPEAAPPPVPGRASTVVPQERQTSGADTDGMKAAEVFAPEASRRGHLRVLRDL